MKTTDGAKSKDESLDFSGNILSVVGDDENDMYHVFFIGVGGTISGYTASSRNGYPEYEF